MNYYIGAVSYNGDYISHHGIRGQKWGVRRYQNEDGPYTNAGLARKTADGIKSAGKKVAGAVKANVGARINYAKEAMAARKENTYEKWHPVKGKYHKNAIVNQLATEINANTKYNKRMHDARVKRDKITQARQIDKMAKKAGISKDQMAEIHADRKLSKNEGFTKRSWEKGVAKRVAKGETLRDAMRNQRHMESAKKLAALAIAAGGTAAIGAYSIKKRGHSLMDPGLQAGAALGLGALAIGQRQWANAQQRAPKVTSRAVKNVQTMNDLKKKKKNPVK